VACRTGVEHRVEIKVCWQADDHVEPGGDDGGTKCHPAETGRRGEGLGRGAAVDDMLGVETLEGSDGMAVVAELAVVVIFDDERVVCCRPAEELVAALGCKGYLVGAENAIHRL